MRLCSVSLVPCLILGLVCVATFFCSPRVRAGRWAPAAFSLCRLVAWISAWLGVVEAEAEAMALDGGMS